MPPAISIDAALMKLAHSLHRNIAMPTTSSGLPKRPSGTTFSTIASNSSRGVPTGILSNGDPDMLGIAVRSAALEGLLDHVISVDAVRKYKTHPAAYALGEQATGLRAGQIVFVSSNSWDALAATWYGYQTLWVNRYQWPFEELGTQPVRTGSSLKDVLDFFPA